MFQGITQKFNLLSRFKLNQILKLLRTIFFKIFLESLRFRHDSDPTRFTSLLHVTKANYNAFSTSNFIKKLQPTHKWNFNHLCTLCEINQFQCESFRAGANEFIFAKLLGFHNCMFASAARKCLLSGVCE